MELKKHILINLNLYFPIFAIVVMLFLNRRMKYKKYLLISLFAFISFVLAFLKLIHYPTEDAMVLISNIRLCIFFFTLGIRYIFIYRSRLYHGDPPLKKLVIILLLMASLTGIMFQPFSILVYLSWGLFVFCLYNLFGKRDWEE